MRLPKIIMVPTDFSACAQQAVDYGVKLAKQLDARLYLMHAWTMPYSRWDETGDRPHDVPPQLSAAAKAALDVCLSAARRELPNVEALYYVGDPVPSILTAAIDIEADMIVIATHGRSGISRMIEGSVTEAVTRRAPCPVLAIRHQPSEVEPQQVSKRDGATRSSAAR
jgi:nucleotide-binding universal stress UspA family protein